MKPFSSNRLEDKYSDAFTTWQKKPSPQTTGALLTAVAPEIDRGISAHVGASHPLIKSRARQITLKAFQSYDPKKAALGTHIVNHLQGLKRASRQQTQILSIPERVLLDQGFLNQELQSATADLGREPSTQELADRTGLSMSRIAKIRKYHQPVNEGYLEAMVGADENPSFMPAVQHQSSAWTEAIYDDLDPVNQSIMELTLGLHGHRPMSNMAIAKRLRLSPGAISQRKATIQNLLSQESELSPF